MDRDPNPERSPEPFRHVSSTIIPNTLKAPHEALIFHYVRLLKEVSSLRLISGRGKRRELYGRDVYVWRGLVRLFIEAHIRRKVLALRNAYALQQTIALSTPNGEDKWFEEAQRSLEKLLTAISSWHRLKLSFATLSPVLVGLIIARFGVDSIYDAVIEMATSKELKAGSNALLSNYGLLTYFMVAVAYLLLPVMRSFRYKRRMLFPESAHQEIPKWEQRLEARERARRGHPPFLEGVNVYEIEDELFRALEVGKPREPYLDVMVAIFTMLTTAAGWSLFLTNMRRTPPYRIGGFLLYLTIILSLLIVFTIGYTIYRAAHRRWR
jgi:hypothetical protein